MTNCPSCKAKLEQMVYDKIAYFLEMGEYEDACFYCGMLVAEGETLMLHWEITGITLHGESVK